MSGAGVGGTLGTALGVALAPETGGMSLAIPALAGAAGSAAGGAFTGSHNIWRDALLGGLGGAAGGALNGGQGLGDLFSAGKDAATTTGALASSTATPFLSNAPDYVPTAFNSTFTPGATSAISSAASSAPSMTSSLLSHATDFAPYAALSLGAGGLDRFMKPKQVGPVPQSHPSNPGSVSPLSRQSQNVDPSSYFAPSTSAARSYYSPYDMQPQFMADGGRVRFANGGSAGKDDREESNLILARMGEDHPMLDAAAQVVNRYNKSEYPGSIYQYMQDEYGDVPVARAMLKAGRPKFKKGGAARFAEGGSSGASSSNIPVGLGMIRGGGDGRSDSIPAQLSDGEFVVSAPVVSALGNGSNDAGARKLSQMQKGVLKKHYKGAKPKKAMGISSYVH